jgi:hypothetical protein
MTLKTLKTTAEELHYYYYLKTARIRLLRNLMNFEKEPENNDMVIVYYNHIKAMQKYHSLLNEPSQDETIAQLRKELDDTRHAYKEARQNESILADAVENFLPQNECRLNLMEFQLHESWSIFELCNSEIFELSAQKKPSDEEKSEANYEEMTEYEKQFFMKSWDDMRKKNLRESYQ